MDIRRLDISRIRSKIILAIGAHPDDLEFAVGGTLILMQENNKIIAVSVTSGQMGAHDEGDSKGELIAVREREQKQASKYYKAWKTIFLQFPDMMVEENKKRLKKRLIKLLVRQRPDIVITHDPWKQYFPYHPDHKAIGFAVYDALLASTLPLYLKKKSVRGQALDPKPALWLMHPNKMSHAADISLVYEKKIEAIRAHKSQFDGVFVWEDVEKLVDSYFSKTGSRIGVEFAEPLRIIE